MDSRKYVCEKCGKEQMITFEQFWASKTIKCECGFVYFIKISDLFSNEIGEASR